MNEQLLLISPQELSLRLKALRALMRANAVEAMLVSNNANKYYLTGRVYSGYAYIPLQGEPVFAVKRPVELQGDGVVYIRKPEDLPAIIGPVAPATALELDLTPYSEVERLAKALGLSDRLNADTILRQARAVKTPGELDLIRRSGEVHQSVYRSIPSLFRLGMTDVELQIEVERRSRLAGCLGEFRIAGDTMELFMGNVIAGNNADAPSPYDFAMGGAGMHPSIPVGANGTEIREGMSVMVDMNGNYTGYMTDMTRTFALGKLPDEAMRAHDLSIAINRMFATEARPGVEAKALYEKAWAMVETQGLTHYYMGHRQHAGFIGHGLGIEVNELPVIAPRSRDILAANNVIALEPKFVIPEVGAVGIENTYIIGEDGTECVTNAPEEIIQLV